MAEHSPKLFVGIDAHQETLAIAVLPEGMREPEPVRTISNQPAKIRALFRELSKRGPIEAVYEAGCFGFVLQRLLQTQKIDCMVAAPSRIPKLPGDHRKTDRLDATRLAMFLQGRQLTAVSPPTPEQEALRSLVHIRESARDDVVRARHRLQKFLLHRGHVWRGGGNWSAKHFAWISEQKMALGEDQLTLDFLRLELDTRLSSLKVLDERIRLRVQEPDVQRKVVALRAFRGVGDLIALNTIASIGDPRRFRRGEQVASYYGMIPSEYSSGQRVKRGPITRSGNPRQRRLIVEAAQHYARPIGRGYARETRRAQAPPAVAELARKADQRLSRRYRALARRKHTNQAKVAVARELVSFLWQALMLCEQT